MRASEWRITWDPAGESPRVLLDHGDTMEEEIAQSLSQAVAVGKFDFSATARPASRGNTKQRLEFSRRITHASAAASWHECSAQLSAAPWGQTGKLKIEPRNGIPRTYIAALLSTSHRPMIDGSEPESLHEYAFRVRSAALVPVGDPAPVTGGTYNPATGVITVTVDNPEDFPPGSTVYIANFPGVTNGNYPVSSSDGGVVRIAGSVVPQPSDLDIFDPENHPIKIKGIVTNSSTEFIPWTLQFKYGIEIQIPAGPAGRKIKVGINAPVSVPNTASTYTVPQGTVTESQTVYWRDARFYSRAWQGYSSAFGTDVAFRDFPAPAVIEGNTYNREILITTGRPGGDAAPALFPSWEVSLLSASGAVIRKITVRPKWSVPFIFDETGLPFEYSGAINTGRTLKFNMGDGALDTGIPTTGDIEFASDEPSQLGTIQPLGYA